MITNWFTFEKQQGLYHNKVTSSLTPVQRLGNQAHNCKRDYCCSLRFTLWISGLSCLGRHFIHYNWLKAVNIWNKTKIEKNRTNIKRARLNDISQAQQCRHAQSWQDFVQFLVPRRCRLILRFFYRIWLEKRERLVEDRQNNTKW